MATKMRQGAAPDSAATQKAAQMAANRAFMRGSIERTAYCPVTGGSGVTAAYSPGTTLYFDMSVQDGGYAKALLITYSLTVTPASTGTASYAMISTAPWNLFS